MPMNFNELGLASSVFGLVGLIISGTFYVKMQRIKSKPQATTAASEQFQTIFNGYLTLIESLQDELERLKLKLVILEQEQAACEKRNEELMLEVHELKTRLDCMGG